MLALCSLAQHSPGYSIDRAIRRYNTDEDIGLTGQMVAVHKRIVQPDIKKIHSTTHLPAWLPYTFVLAGGT